MLFQLMWWDGWTRGWVGGCGGVATVTNQKIKQLCGPILQAKDCKDFKLG